MADMLRGIVCALRGLYTTPGTDRRGPGRRRAARILGILALAAAGTACATPEGRDRAVTATSPDDPDRSRERAALVDTSIATKDIDDPAVLRAMRSVPRHRFVPEEYRARAYEDRALPIGSGQTISQPYIVALMTQLAGPGEGQRALEIGTGSGYQAAVLAECFGTVHSIEILPDLGRRARLVLDELGYDNVTVRIGDGYDGWPAEAPFDAIVVTAAPEAIPRPLLEQLAPGGRLVIPIGRGSQDLVVVTRVEDGFERQIVAPVLFVPMRGKTEES